MHYELCIMNYELMHVHPPVDVQANSREIIAAFAAEEGDGQADVTHFAKTERHGGGQFGDAFLAMCLVKQFCFDDAWGDGVYGDAVRRGRAGQRLREAQDAAFRGSVMDMAEQRALMGDHRRHVDDAAEFPFAHADHRRLAAEKDAFQIRLQNIVPVFLRDVENVFRAARSRVVHKQVDFAEFCVDFGEKPLDVV